MASKNEIIQIVIEDLTVEGAGIGRHEGMAVFVPGALPGETVSAKVIKAAKNYLAGRLVEVTVASPHRIEPFCPQFRQCGGCTLQHLAYPAQVAYKAKHISDCFARLGKIEIDTPEVLPANNLRDYRNKAAFPVAESGGELQAGFYAPRSHRVVPGDCPVQKKAVNGVKNAVIAWARKNKIRAYDERTRKGDLRHIIVRQTSCGEVLAGIVVQSRIADEALAKSLVDIGAAGVIENINDQNTNVILGDETRVAGGQNTATQRYGGLDFSVSLESFLQVNDEQTEKLYQTAMEFAQIKGEDTVFDLFCGIGTMTLMAAKNGKKALGIEYAQSAVDNARENATRNGIENAAFTAGDAAACFSEAVSSEGAPDVVIVDPPRKGCEKALLKDICAVKPNRVVYVSCNPATLARDAAVMKEHGYAIRAITGVDMFPHTTHIETVTLFKQ